MMKGAIGASWVIRGASGRGVSESVAVCALGVAVSLRRFLDFQRLREEEDGWEEDWNVVGVDGDDHQSGLLCEPSSSAPV